MKPITLLRGAIVALGVVDFVYQGMTRKTGAGAAVPVPLRTAPLSPVVAAVALAGGLVLLYAGASALIAAVPAGRAKGSLQATGS